MKKLLSLCLTLLLLLSLMTCQFVVAEGTEEVVPNQLIVSFEKDDTMGIASVNNEEAALEDIGLEVKESLIKTLNDGEMRIYSNNDEILETMGSLFVVEYDSEDYLNYNLACSSIKNQLENKGFDVKYVEPDYVVRALEDEVTAQYNSNQTWHYNMIKVQEGWNLNTNPSSVKVAIIDTGIDYDHSSLANYIDTTNAKSYVGGTADDGQGHGTHVAGTVASYGTVSGVCEAPVSLLPVRVLDSNGSGSTSNVTSGIIYAADKNADVINMSLGGGGFSQSLQDACTYAYNAGTVVVAASGNESASSVSYPGACDNVLAVGAVDSSGNKASFSNYGSALDVMAPGVNIYSCQMGGGFTTMSGTSMASPHVAGAAALLRSANPDATVQEVMNALCETASRSTWNNTYGYGIINCEDAVEQIMGDNPNPPTPPTPEDPEEPDDPITNELTITTEYSADYYRIYQDITVTDSNGNAVSGVTLSLRLTTPTGTTLTGSTTTDSYGTATFSLRYANYGYGNYTYRLTASKTGYQTETLTETVTLR